MHGLELFLNQDFGGLGRCFASFCGYWIKSSMTVRDAGNDGRPAIPLWIADQVRNDVTMLCIVLWILDQVQYDGPG